MNNSLLEKLLNHYHITEAEFLELSKVGTLDDFASGHSFKDIDKAASMVKDAMHNNESIAIYGDYDADGIMGTSILVKMFKMLNYQVSYYIPNRYQDGYGITLKKAKEFVNNGIKLVITVDNGVSAFEPIQYLKENNVKVLILDHHQIGETLPNADYVIHPIYSGFGETTSSGAFTAFMFSREMLGYYDKYLSTLAAISLISDLMPLRSYNRRLLKTVFKNYQDGEFLNISLLANHERLDENAIGMGIAPRINSIGRLTDNDSINDIIPFFSDDNEEYQLNYFEHILEINEQRRAYSKLTTEITLTEDHAIVCFSEAKEGIIGLIANNLLSRYNRPVIVFTKGEDGTLKGSARSNNDLNIVDTFNALKKYIITGGGHASAGGCSIDPKNYEAFKNAFIAIANKYDIIEKDLENESIVININDINEENYRIIEALSPFGVGWGAPSLELRRIKTSSLMYSKNGEHILTQLGQKARLVAFNCPKEKMEQSNFVDFFGNLRKNSYRGYVSVEFLAKTYQNSKQ